MNQSNVLILYQQRNRRVSSTPVLNFLPGINNNEFYNSCNLGIIGKIVRRNFIFLSNSLLVTPRDLAETIDSGPLCTTDLSKVKSVAYYLFISAFI